MPPDYVRLVNKDPEQFFRAKHATGIPLAVAPASDTIVPWETACFLMGDPSLRDVSPREPYRTQALHRLSVYYGCSEVGIDHIVEAFPKIAVIDSDGAEIAMILNDPKGLAAPWAGDAPSSSHEMDALRSQVAQMAKNQEMLMALLTQREQAQAASEMSPVGEARDGSSDGGLPAAPADDVKFDEPRRVKAR